MNWDTKRKTIYAFALFIIVFSSLLFFLKDVLFPNPTCVDKKQNGYELGVDCGGSCALKCSQEVLPLTVVWAKAVPVKENVYDLVAMISNSNIDNASHGIGYTFTVYDENTQVMATLSGTTTAPIDGKFPVIIQNIPLITTPTKVIATITDGPHYTVAESPKSPTIKILSRAYEAGIVSQVSAKVMNTKRVEIVNLPVRVVLYDTKDNAYAVGQTIIPSLPKEGVRDIYVTWSNPLPTAPTRIDIFPIFNPFEAITF